MGNLMIIEIYKDGEWIESSFEEIDIGCKFRMRNPDTKELFIGDNDEVEFVAASECYVKNLDVDHSILTVDVEKE